MTAGGQDLKARLGKIDCRDVVDVANHLLEQVVFRIWTGSRHSYVAVPPVPTTEKKTSGLRTTT